MSETWAILPVKAFDRAKSRLSGALPSAECEHLARLMATDVLRALTATPPIDRVLVLGQGSEQAALARRFGCRYENDEPALDVSANLTRVAQMPIIQSASRFLLVAADLPHIRCEDLSRILGAHEEGVTICRAARDGGTNAFIATMPQRIRFCFGTGSAARHSSAAKASGQSVRVLDDPAFRRDIDMPDDLRWLSRRCRSCDTVRFLRRLSTRDGSFSRSA